MVLIVIIMKRMYIFIPTNLISFKYNRKFCYNDIRYLFRVQILSMQVQSRCPPIYILVYGERVL